MSIKPRDSKEKKKQSLQRDNERDDVLTEPVQNEQPNPAKTSNDPEIFDSELEEIASEDFDLSQFEEFEDFEDFEIGDFEIDVSDFEIDLSDIDDELSQFLEKNPSEFTETSSNDVKSSQKKDSIKLSSSLEDGWNQLEMSLHGVSPESIWDSSEEEFGAEMISSEKEEESLANKSIEDLMRELVESESVSQNSEKNETIELESIIQESIDSSSFKQNPFALPKKKSFKKKRISITEKTKSTKQEELLTDESIEMDDSSIETKEKLLFHESLPEKESEHFDENSIEEKPEEVVTENSDEEKLSEEKVIREIESSLEIRRKLLIEESLLEEESEHFDENSIGEKPEEVVTESSSEEKLSEEKVIREIESSLEIKRELLTEESPLESEKEEVIEGENEKINPFIDESSVETKQKLLIEESLLESEKEEVIEGENEKEVTQEIVIESFDEEKVIQEIVIEGPELEAKKESVQDELQSGDISEMIENYLHEDHSEPLDDIDEFVCEKTPITQQLSIDESRNTGTLPTVEEPPCGIQIHDPTNRSLSENLNGDTTLIDDIPFVEEIEKTLEKMKKVTGFLGAIVFSPYGELIAKSNHSTIELDNIMSLANELLSNTYMTAKLMKFNHQNLAVEITAEKATIMIRCLSAKGLHAHLAFVMSKNANIAMTKLRICKITNDLVEIMA